MDGLLTAPRARALGYATILLLATGSASCAPLLTAMYVIKGINAPAAFTGLKGKRVAVVCRPVVSLEFSNTSVSRDLARKVSQLLTQNGRRIHVVDPREIERWTDENMWDDFVEVGRAVNAEMLVAVELESFSLYEGATIFQGKANYSLTVFDVATGEAVFERTPPQSSYPPTTGIPTTDMQEPDFRRHFVARLAEEIGRHFYEHDPRVDFAAQQAVF